MENTNAFVDTILENAKAELLEFCKDEPTITCSIEYEAKLLQLALSYSRNVLQNLSGALPQNRKGKKKL